MHSRLFVCFVSFLYLTKIISWSLPKCIVNSCQYAVYFSSTASQGSLWQPFIFLHAVAAQRLPGLGVPDLICTWKPWIWLVLEKHSGILDITHNPNNENLVNISLQIPNTLGRGGGQESKSQTVTTDNVAQNIDTKTRDHRRNIKRGAELKKPFSFFRQWTPMFLHSSLGLN